MPGAGLVLADGSVVLNWNGAGLCSWAGHRTTWYLLIVEIAERHVYGKKSAFSIGLTHRILDLLYSTRQSWTLMILCRKQHTIISKHHNGLPLLALQSALNQKTVWRDRNLPVTIMKVVTSIKRDVLSLSRQETVRVSTRQTFSSWLHTSLLSLLIQEKHMRVCITYFMTFGLKWW